MLHTGADPAKEPVESKANGVNPTEMQVQLTATCHQTETRAGMPITQTLFVVTYPVAESSSKTSQVSSTYVRRKARTDSGILSNYSLSSSEVNEFCVSPTLSSRSVNSSSFSSPKFDTSTGKSSLIYPTQGGKNAVPEPDARHEMFKLYPHLLSTKELDSIYPLQTSSTPEGSVADFPQTSVNQAQSPFSGVTGLQETHFPDAAGEFNYADADWDQPHVVKSYHHEVFAPPPFSEVAKNGVLPGVTKKSSNSTSNGEPFIQPVIIPPVRAQQQFQTAPAVATAISPIKNDREPDAFTDSNQQIDPHQDGKPASCFQGLENSPDCQASGEKYPGVSEQKTPCIMNPNSYTSLTPDSEDEQTVDEISDRELFSEPSSFQGNNKIVQPDDEGLNSVNSMGDTGTTGVLVNKVECSPTFAKPPTNVENNGLPSFTKDDIILSPRQESQNLAKSGPTTGQTDAHILDSTRNGVAESSEVPLQSSDGRNHGQIKPENSSVRAFPAEQSVCSPITAHLESTICPESTSNLAAQQSVPDKSTTLSADSDAQSESASTASSDPPTQISRAASEYDLQTANFYLREHQHPPSDFASNGGIANATFPRMKTGRFAAIPRPSPSILRLVETAYESYERFPSLGLPYSEEQSRIDAKRCILMVNVKLFCPYTLMRVLFKKTK
ncbi:unnamed protein product [Dibothriocephalus latus]|uniref:Uncharacterized protein n=1 Tax=Dibothriocephalus latus TaxID=60516 RepID=A0A3P6UF95_DIBLA|nr:unnamed protein product [Dibothriocephalus latus]